MERPAPYRQETSFSCGAAALLMAYRRLGIRYNEPTLILELGTNQEEGTEMNKMYEHASSYGFPTEMKCNQTYEDLQKDFKKGQVIVPITVDWGGEPGGHYVLVSDIDPDMIELADSGIEIDDWPEIMSKKEFLVKWRCSYYNQSYLLICPKK